MALFLIGLGLGDEKDISVKGLEIVRAADRVFLEAYTSVLGVDKQVLERYYGCEVVVADRDLVEKNAEKILAPAKSGNVVFLVVGDPFGATTHADLVLRARAAGVEVVVVHNASIMNAVGVVGLELYKYGRTASVPYWAKSFEPETPYDIVKENKARGLHTLCLLDIKTEEEPPRFMTVKEALELLLRIEERRGGGVIAAETLVVGVARLGRDDQRIVAGTVEQLLAVDFGGPLHSLIVPGALHDVEEEMLERFR